VECGCQADYICGMCFKIERASKMSEHHQRRSFVRYFIEHTWIFPVSGEWSFKSKAHQLNTVSMK